MRMGGQTDRQADRHEEFNSTISQLCQRAKNDIHTLKNLFQEKSAFNDHIIGV